MFGLQLGYDSKVQNRVNDNANRLRETLYKMLSSRRSKLPSISHDVIRLTKEDLAAAINTAEPVVTEYVKNRIFPFFKPANTDSFWATFDLAPNDYYELTKKVITLHIDLLMRVLTGSTRSCCNKHSARPFCNLSKTKTRTL